MTAEIERSMMFADLAGYTALTQAHGDERAAGIAMRFFELTNQAIADHGRLVKTLGDGVMGVANTIEDVIVCARGLAQALEQEPGFPGARVGIHHGAVVERGADCFGHAVNLTARLMQRAEPEQVLCSEIVARVATSAGLARVQPLGNVAMKNMPQPIAIYELLLDSRDHRTGDIDPVCRMRVEPATRLSVEHGGTKLHFCSRDCMLQFAGNPEQYLDRY